LTIVQNEISVAKFQADTLPKNKVTAE